MKPRYEVFMDNVPSVNTMYFHLKTGIRIPTKELKDFKGSYNSKKVFLPGRGVKALDESKIPSFPAEVKVVIEAWAYWPDRRKRDFNNFAKAIIDVFVAAGIVPDDNQILWREQDFEIKKGLELKNAFKLVVYEKE
jgi:Holliday junction resolvase RusA-like endonuclease